MLVTARNMGGSLTYGYVASFKIFD